MIDEIYTWCHAPFPRAGPETINPYGAAPERHGFLNSVTPAEGSSEQTQSRPAECQFFQIGKSQKKNPDHLLLLSGYLTALDAGDDWLTASVAHSGRRHYWSVFFPTSCPEHAEVKICLLCVLWAVKEGCFLAALPFRRVLV